MFSLLRFAHTLMRPMPGPPLEPDATVVTHWRVLPGDIDVFGHMNNSRYLVIMDLGRIDFLRRCNLFAGVVRQRWAVPVGGAHMAFRRSLKPLERFALHTRLLHWDERWFYFRQDFIRASAPGQPVCTGHVKTLFTGRHGAVPTVEVVRQLAGRPLVAPPLSDEVRRVFDLAADTAAGDAPQLPAAAAQPACGPYRTA